MTTSTNPWTPPGETDDAVLARMEAMIAPTFGDEALPVPASDDAELPWTSGGAAVGIEPDFDVAGLPTLATPDSQLAWTTRTGPLTGPASGPVPPAAPGAPLAPPAPPAGAALPPPPPAAPTAPPAPGSSLPPPPVALDTGTQEHDRDAQDRDVDRAPAAPTASWGAPDATQLSPVQLPPPVVVAPVDRPWNARPRRGLLLALALSLVAALVAVVLIGTRDPQASPAPVVVPSDPTLADVPGAPEADLPLVLPGFPGTVVDYRSSTVRVVDETPSGQRSLTVTGPLSENAIAVTLDQGADSRPERAVVALNAIFTRRGGEWVRTPVDEASRSRYEGVLGARAFDDVIPSEVRPLVQVTQVQDLDETTRRYMIEVRADAFAEGYPDLFEQWLAVHTLGAPIEDRATIVVDVDEVGLVSSVTVDTVEGEVTTTVTLSDEPSDVAVPEEFVRGD